MATPIPPNKARFSLPEVALATHGTITHRARDSGKSGDHQSTEATIGAVTDSRAVTPSSLFVALKGEAHDGHKFIDAAIEKGARIVVVERGRSPVTSDIASFVEVDDTLVAWGNLARAHLVKWRMEAVDGRVVAITGSAGKTTTKELTAALLAQVAPTHYTAGNLNNRIGVPAVIFALESHHQFCVLEMGMSLPGEIEAICQFASPDVSVIVNVGVAHSEGVGGREGVMHEKGAVYRALGPQGIAIINSDDDYVKRAAQGIQARKHITFGRSGSPSPLYRLVDRAPEREGSRVLYVCAGRDLSLYLPLPGEAAAIDLAAALAAQEAASRELLSVETIEKALERVMLEGRGTVRRLGSDVIVLDDTYNANPASMRASLDTLNELAKDKNRRKIFVVGEMKELGALAREEHEALGDAIAAAKIDLVIGCGGELIGRTLERAKSKGVQEVVEAESTAAASKAATLRVQPGDAVLVKGSRGVRAEVVVSALTSVFPMSPT